MKARKKVVEVDFLPYNNYKEVSDWVKSLGDSFDDNFSVIEGALFVNTLEGTSYEVVSDRDVIIRGVKGEYYPCRADIFEETYDIVWGGVCGKQLVNNNGRISYAITIGDNSGDINL